MNNQSTIEIMKSILNVFPFHRTCAIPRGVAVKRRTKGSAGSVMIRQSSLNRQSVVSYKNITVCYVLYRHCIPVLSNKCSESERIIMHQYTAPLGPYFLLRIISYLSLSYYDKVTRRISCNKRTHFLCIFRK